MRESINTGAWRVNRDLGLATCLPGAASGKASMHPDPGSDSVNFLKLRLAALAIELTALVDEMEAEWREHGELSEESARHLHELLGRAERVFADPVAAMRIEETSPKKLKARWDLGRVSGPSGEHALNNLIHSHP